MKCPSCGFEQQDGLTECQKCGIIFSKWQARESQKAISEFHQPATDATAPKEQNTPPILLTIVLLALTVLAGWWLYFPKGLAIPADAYKNEKHHFALSPPSDWVMLTPENFQQIFAQYGDSLPSSMKDAMQNPNLAVGFTKIVSAGEFAPSMNVVIVKGRMPPLTEKEKREAVNALTSELATHFENYKMEEAIIIDVDKLKSLRITSTGSMRVMTSQGGYQQSGPWGQTYVPPTYQIFDLKFVQTAIPGKEEAYILTCMSLADVFEQHSNTFDNILNSFRVTKRPDRFGPIMTSSLKGGIIGMAGYLLFALLKALAKL